MHDSLMLRLGVDLKICPNTKLSQGDICITPARLGGLSITHIAVCRPPPSARPTETLHEQLTPSVSTRLWRDSLLRPSVAAPLRGTASGDQQPRRIHPPLLDTRHQQNSTPTSSSGGQGPPHPANNKITLSASLSLQRTALRSNPTSRPQCSGATPISSYRKTVTGLQAPLQSSISKKPKRGGIHFRAATWAKVLQKCYHPFVTNYGNTEAPSSAAVSSASRWKTLSASLSASGRKTDRSTSFPCASRGRSPVIFS